MPLNLPTEKYDYPSPGAFHKDWNKPQKGEDLSRFPGSPSWEQKVAAAKTFRDHLTQTERREYEEQPQREWVSSGPNSTPASRYINNVTDFSLPVALIKKWVERRRAAETAYADQLEQLARTLSKVKAPASTGDARVDQARLKMAEDNQVVLDLWEGQVQRGELRPAMHKRWVEKSNAAYAERDAALARNAVGKPRKSFTVPASSSSSRKAATTPTGRKLVKPVQIVVTDVTRKPNSPSGNPIWELTLFGGKKVRTERDSQFGHSMRPMIKGEPPRRMTVEYSSRGTIHAGFETGRQ